VHDSSLAISIVVAQDYSYWLTMKSSRQDNCFVDHHLCGRPFAISGSLTMSDRVRLGSGNASAHARKFCGGTSGRSANCLFLLIKGALDTFTLRLREKDRLLWLTEGQYSEALLFCQHYEYLVALSS